MTQRNLYEVPLDNGEVLLIAALSPYVRNGLYQLATEAYPDPDKTPYEQEVPNAAVPMKTPAEDNLEYRQLRATAQVRRLAAFYESVLRSGCIVGVVGGIEAALERYDHELRTVRKAMKLEGERDDFLDLVKYVLLSNGKEVQAIANAATVALTQEEVTRGVESFRYQVEWSTAGRHHFTKVTPSPE